jgi:spore germination protein KB
MRQVPLDNGKITAHQFKVLVILIFLGTAVLLMPGTLATAAKQDAWIAAGLGTVGSLALVWFYSIVGKQIGNLTLIGYIKKVFGRRIGAAVSFVFVSFLYLNSATLVWVVGSFMTTQLMTETPVMVINSIYMAVVVVGSRLGLETTARCGEILFPWVIGGLIFLLLFSVPEVDIKNVQPLLEGGIKPIIQGAVIFQAFISLTLAVLLMI